MKKLHVLSTTAICCGIISFLINIFLINKQSENVSEGTRMNPDDEWIMQQSKKYAILDFINFQRRQFLDSTAKSAVVNNNDLEYRQLYRQFRDVGRLSDFLTFSLQMALINDNPQAYLNTFNILKHINQKEMYSKRIEAFSKFFLSKYLEIDSLSFKGKDLIFTEDTTFNIRDILPSHMYLKLIR